MRCHQILGGILASKFIKNSTRSSDDSETAKEFKMDLYENIYKFELDGKNVEMRPVEYYFFLLTHKVFGFSTLLKMFKNNKLLQELYNLTLEALIRNPQSLNDRDQLYIPLLENETISVKTANDFIKKNENTAQELEMFVKLSDALVKIYERPSPLLKQLTEFIQKNPTFSRNGFSAFRFAVDCLFLSMNTSAIDQKNSHLCGMASFMFVLLNSAPETYFKFVSDLFKDGVYNNNFQIRLPNSVIDVNKFVHEIIMIAIKKSVNYFGYFPNNSLLEMFGGITRPELLVRLLENVGFHDIKENMAVKKTNGQELGRFGQMIVGGLYSAYHQRNNKPDFLENLQKELLEGNVIILSFSPFELDKALNRHKPETQQPPHFLNIRSDHCVTLLNINFVYEVDQESVDLRFMDTVGGGIYRINEIPMAVAIKAINGAIIATPPAPSPALKNTYTQNKSS